MMSSTGTNPQPEKRIWRRWWRTISILLPILLIILILQNISIEAILLSLSKLDINLLLIAWVLNIMVVLLMALRWWFLYFVIQQRPSYLHLVKVTFVSILFNTILPSVVGGDTYRTLTLGKGDRGSGEVERSFSVVFVDRIMGLLALMILGCGGLLFNTTVQVPAIVSFLTVLLLVAFLLILLLSMYHRFYQLLIAGCRWLPDRHFQIIKQMLYRIHSNIALYQQHKTLLIVALVISFVQRLIWLLAGYYIAVALHLNLSIMIFLLFLPVIEIIRLIPITIQGIGVREGLFVVFFGTVGVSNSDAVLLATLIYLMSSLIGVLGGLIYLVDSLSNWLITRQTT